MEVINPAVAYTDEEWERLAPDLRSELETQYVLSIPGMKEKLARYSENQGKKLAFEGDAWEQYTSLNEKSQKKFREIVNEMLQSDDPSQGIGKPSKRKDGKYSRHLSKKDLLVYTFDNKNIFVHSLQTLEK